MNGSVTLYLLEKLQHILTLLVLPEYLNPFFHIGKLLCAELGQFRSLFKEFKSLIQADLTVFQFPNDLLEPLQRIFKIVRFCHCMLRFGLDSRIRLFHIRYLAVNGTVPEPRLDILVYRDIPDRKYPTVVPGP